MLLPGQKVVAPETVTVGLAGAVSMVTVLLQELFDAWASTGKLVVAARV